MGQNSAIGWTNHTFNPWWGCTKVSDGCKNCYAATFAGRFGVEWGKDKPRRTFGVKHWNEPLKWNTRADHSGVRERVFCASMADVFEDDAPMEEVASLRRLVGQTKALDWLLLTKRPQNIGPLWHLDNVWLGTSVESRDVIDRIDQLRAKKATIRFLSCEPLLGDLGRLDLSGIHWVIAGAESGHRARPMDEDWVRRLRDQTKEMGAAFFYKQNAVNGKKVIAPELDGRQWLEFPSTTQQEGKE